ncbi:signal peptidase I, partial [Candidatus Woesearchaeota archaeon]|nr:signal peptidase I [Candidatus Woesearchaeota archaeon]
MNYNTSCVTYAQKEVRGRSMEPLFYDGETVALLNGYYDCNDAKRGDIIAYNYSGNDNPIIKRIIAEGGDLLEFDDDLLLINNRPLKNSENKTYVFSEKQKNMINLYIEEGRLVEDAFLIFGEDTKSSTDSR